MTHIRVFANQVRFVIKDMRFVIHAVQIDEKGRMVSHVDITAPVSQVGQLGRVENRDGIDYSEIMESDEGSR